MAWIKRQNLTSIPKVKENRFSQFVLLSTLFVLVSPAALWLLDVFSIRSYFLLSFVWLLISSEVFAPTDPDTKWWEYVLWIKVIGWLVLILIVVERGYLVVG